MGWFQLAKVDLTTNFCNFDCPNPFLLAASPVARTADMIMRAFEMGWGGAISKSLALDQDLPDRSLTPRFSRLSANQYYFAGMGNIDFRIDQGVRETIEDWSRVKRKYPKHFFAVSIKSPGVEKNWRELASLAESTGADAIELCLSCPDDDSGDGNQSLGHNPDKVQEVIGWVQKETSLPILIKLTPSITNILPIGLAAQEAGAVGLSATNTIKSLTGVSLDNLVPEPVIGGRSWFNGLSGAALKPIAMRIIAELAQEEELTLQLAGVGGVRDWRDAVEYLLYGATVVQVATEIMYRGYGIVEELIDGVEGFLLEKGFSRTKELVGLSLKNMLPTEQLSRKYRVAASFDPDKCIGCGRCYVSCRDGGYQAIDFDLKERKPVFREEDCHGCGLCTLVCPVQNCIVMKETKTPFPSGENVKGGENHALRSCGYCG